MKHTRGVQKVRHLERCSSKNTLLRSALQYNMTHIHHAISLHNLPVASDTCRNVALIVRCPDDSKSLLGPAASLEQLSEPGHRWKIVFHPNVP
ncbi:hypothetical protein AVEN_24955-1 [Araneus ventricosus]|uniref:Uncharacterized protein n=1 Tax=Araneus ventricosus TaxID=182803 RepID=A0A4Y2G696_ARAVE|nr:hypothetical protein AVEN_24955-1 [Araneus ventricosus]